MSRLFCVEQPQTYEYIYINLLCLPLTGAPSSSVAAVYSLPPQRLATLLSWHFSFNGSQHSVQFLFFLVGRPINFRGIARYATELPWDTIGSRRESREIPSEAPWEAMSSHETIRGTPTGGDGNSHGIPRDPTGHLRGACCGIPWGAVPDSGVVLDCGRMEEMIIVFRFRQMLSDKTKHPACKASCTTIAQNFRRAIYMRFSRGVPWDSTALRQILQEVSLIVVASSSRLPWVSSVNAKECAPAGFLCSLNEVPYDLVRTHERFLGAHGNRWHLFVPLAVVVGVFTIPGAGKSRLGNIDGVRLAIAMGSSAVKSHEIPWPLPPDAMDYVHAFSHAKMKRVVKGPR